MSNTNWTVEGRTFRYKKEYLEALSDKKKIEKIKKEYIWNDFVSITSLKNEMDHEKISFFTLVGKDFEDDVYMQYELLKKKEANAVPYNSDKKKKKNKLIKKNIKLDDFDEDMQERILDELKKKEHKRIFILILCFCIAIGCLSYFFLYDYMQKRTDADVNDWVNLKEQNIESGTEKEFEYIPSFSSEFINEEELEILDEYKILVKKNKTLIGWIKIDDTYIDYPVMQAADNEYYLSHNFNQEKDNNGCIFLDFQSDFVNRDTNIILYGHNMSSGKMFGSLKNYQEEDFYLEHKEIQFDTIYEKGTYQIMYVFHGQIYKEKEIAFKYYQFFDAKSDKEFNSYMESMADLSLYNTGISASFGDQLITLSTCDGSDTTKRFVVVAKRIE